MATAKNNTLPISIHKKTTHFQLMFLCSVAEECKNLKRFCDEVNAKEVVKAVLSDEWKGQDVFKVYI